MANVVNIATTNTFEEWRLKNNEIGAIIGDLTLINTNAMSGEGTLIPTVNNLRTETTNNAGWIGDISLLFDGYGNLVEALNNAHADISTIAAVSNIDIDSASVANYDGTGTSWIDILNTDYARLNAHDVEIGTIGDLYDTTNYPSLVTSTNNLNSRLSDIETDVGDWAIYSGSDTTIVAALNTVKAIHDDIGADFLDASGDTITGDLNFTSGGVQATGQYLNMGVGGINTIRINTSNRVGVGKAAHTSYKFDVSGTLNATDLKIGGESLDDRFLEVNTVSSWDEIGAQVKFNNNTTFADEVKLGTKVIYNTSLSFDEVVQDISGGMFDGNTESGGVWAAYSDSTGKVTLGITDDGHNHVVGNIDNFTENVQDVVGGMVTSNSESGIQVVYQDGDGTLDFNVNDPTITLTGDVSGSATMSNLGDVTITTSVTANNVALGTDTTGNYVKKGATSGSGISGSVDSEGGTFTVVSSATASNTANTIVFRDASRNFSANNINVNAITASGDMSVNTITANGAITVNANDNASYIYMHDSDHGSRSIHCNSNNIGFLAQDNSWGAWTDDSGNWFAKGDITAQGGDMYATTFHGNATSANYADLAENYRADQEYEVGTVLSFGGSWEVTQSNKKVDTRIAGVVSTEPAYLMNAEQQGEFITPVALMGRVPCKVQGAVRKGDMLVSAGNGRARVVDTPLMGSVIGKALADSDGDNIIEVVVGKL
jgi:hypothetical protein